jgi:hypothetical protein
MKRPSSPTTTSKTHGHAQTTKVAASAEQPIVGRKEFAKISEVEGMRLSDDMKRMTADFDRRGLSPEERRQAIIQRFKRVAGK